MRLKEIKPGMAIYCTTREQIAEIRKTGIRGLNQIDIENYMTPPCYVIIYRNFATHMRRTDDVKKLYPDADICEFDDLVIPEPSAKEEYNRGLNDAWELARKICFYQDMGGWSLNEMKKIMGTTSCIDAMTNHTPQEVLAKFEAYEKEQLGVGDVVENSGIRGIITMVKEKYFVVVCKDGSAGNWLREHCEKTSKYIDISAILAEIENRNKEQ